jgi:signal transduction histidine kinase
VSVEYYRKVLSGPNRVYWYCLVGLFLWGTTRALGVDADGPKVRYGPFALVMLLEALNFGGRIFAQRTTTKSGEVRIYRKLSWIFVAADFLLIVAGVRLTGGLHSPIWVVTFVVVSGETVLEGMREAVITRLSACVALFLGTVPLPPETLDLTAYALEMYVRMGFLLAVSSVIRRLRVGSDDAKAEVANLRGDLALAQERARLSREIHDGVGNSLAGAVLRLEMSARVREKTLGEPDETVDVLKEEAGALREVMTGVRDWTFHNRPWSTEGVPASVALQTEADRLARRTGLSVSVEGAGLLDALPEPARIAALRIVQESLTNVAKHAGARSATIQLARDGGTLTLTVADDGAGFDAGIAGAGVGLDSMRERAVGIGGTLAVESAPGGTTVILTIPLRN